MILLELDKETYTINDDFKVNPQNDIIENALISSLDLYDSPSQGFKTSFIADKLKSTLGIGVKVHLVNPKTIARSEGKAKRVIDMRKLK